MRRPRTPDGSLPPVAPCACGRTDMGGRGMCRRCYKRELARAVAAGGEVLARWRAYQSPKTPPCACGRRHYAFGLCRVCYTANPDLGRRARATRERYVLANAEKVKAGRRAYYQRTKSELKNPTVTRSERLRMQGLTPEQYDAMYAAQEGMCALCRRPETEAHGRWKGTKRLAVDHDHDTGQVRGLLCRKCNTGLGLLGDRLEGAWAAVNYLTAGALKLTA